MADKTPAMVPTRLSLVQQEDGALLGTQVPGLPGNDTLVGSGSRGSPWTLEPVQKEVRKLPHAGPSLGVPFQTGQ